MHIKRKPIVWAGAIILLLAFGGVIFSVVTEGGRDEHKVEQGIERLASAKDPIVKVDQTTEYEWYLTEMEQGRGYERIKSKISSKGWTFVEQEGAGYFFEKEGRKLIVTTEMWTGKYVLAKVPVQVND